MTDGIYQSVMCYFMPYLMYRPANFETMSGLNISDRTRIGCVVAACAILSTNFYVMFNSYNWDWLTVLINCISSLLLFFWTGVFTSGSLSYDFGGAAHEVYGTLNFWICLLLTIVMALLPRFVVKSVQKVFFPYDTDIIREQKSMGKFAYLDNYEQYVPPSIGSDAGNTSDETGSTELGKPPQQTMKQENGYTDDYQSVYPQFVTPAGNFENPRSQDGSVTTTNYAPSIDRYHSPQSTEYTLDRNRPSFERIPRSFSSGIEPTSEAVYHVPHNAENPFKAPNDQQMNVI